MKRKPVGKIIVNILVILLCCVWLVPVYMVIVNAFKSRAELYENIFAFPKHFTLEYFQGALKKMDFLMAFKNSIIVTVIAVGIIVLLSAMTAWMFVRSNNKLSKFLYGLLILTMLIPFQTIMITLLKAMSVIRLSGSRVGLGIQYWGFGIPMAVFIFYNFMKTIPKELDESAQIDGASTMRTFISVIFPLLKSVTVTVLVLDVMWIWNDFLLPLLMVNASNTTKTLVLAAYTFVGQMNTQWQYAMTGMVLAVFPSILVFIFLQKYIVEGVVAGAVKG